MSDNLKKTEDEKSISDTLEEIIEMKKIENSALKKIFDSFNTPNKKTSKKIKS